MTLRGMTAIVLMVLAAGCAGTGGGPAAEPYTARQLSGEWKGEWVSESGFSDTIRVAFQKGEADWTFTLHMTQPVVAIEKVVVPLKEVSPTHLSGEQLGTRIDLHFREEAGERLIEFELAHAASGTTCKAQARHEGNLVRGTYGWTGLCADRGKFTIER